eukprot:TRINITY_DN967_c0_g1_i5.p3 TRINITY_DN967_c0_g1~~TRINITY_DN967_c0_g1_i5.p3  ORF type:complete len:113 (-),score=9.60 TRINITY_DN967_c0_g1_i5:107-445(-)
MDHASEITDEAVIKQKPRLSVPHSSKFLQESIKVQSTNCKRAINARLAEAHSYKRFKKTNGYDVRRQIRCRLEKLKESLEKATADNILEDIQEVNKITLSEAQNDIKIQKVT